MKALKASGALKATGSAATTQPNTTVQNYPGTPPEAVSLAMNHGTVTARFHYSLWDKVGKEEISKIPAKLKSVAASQLSRGAELSQERKSSLLSKMEGTGHMTITKYSECPLERMFVPNKGCKYNVK